MKDNQKFVLDVSNAQSEVEINVFNFHLHVTPFTGSFGFKLSFIFCKYQNDYNGYTIHTYDPMH